MQLFLRTQEALYDFFGELGVKDITLVRFDEPICRR